MGALLLVHRVPWPPNRGDKIRSYHLLRALLARGEALGGVHLAAFAEEAKEHLIPREFADQLRSSKIIRRKKSNMVAGAQALLTKRPISLTAFAHSAMTDYVNHLTKRDRISHIIAFSGQMAQYVPSKFSGHFLFDMVDVDSAKFESYAQNSPFPMAWIYRREGHLLSQFEHRIARRAHWTTLVSEAEAELMRARSSLDEGRVKALGNGIDLNAYHPECIKPIHPPKIRVSEQGQGLEQSSNITTSHQQRERIKPNKADNDYDIKPGAEAGIKLIFTGQMDYPPNIEAVKSFTHKVMPALCEIYADIAFWVVGRAPPPALYALDGIAGTRIIGEVEDIKGWIMSADIVVAPLRTARGIQNKVLEAMALGKAVVASGPAAEGLDVVHGRDLLVGAGPREEIAAIKRLITDKAYRVQLGMAARKRMEQCYSWEAQFVELSSLLGLEDLEDDLELAMSVHDEKGKLSSGDHR